MRLGGFGTVGPDLIDRIAIDRHQLGAPACERFLRLLYPVARVEPGIVSDASSFGACSSSHCVVLVSGTD